MVVVLSIQVTSPAKGQTWYQGDTCEIRWQASISDTMAETVKILLLHYFIADAPKKLRSGSPFLPSDLRKIGVLTRSTPNNGFFRWTIPSIIRTGVRVIRVQTVDNKIWGDSEAFIIKSKTTPKVHRAPPAPTGPFTGIRLKVIDLINQYRNSKGLYNLIYDYCLCLSAQKHAEWIAQMGYDFFYDKNGKMIRNSHDEPSGTSEVKGCIWWAPTELDFPFVNPPEKGLAERIVDGWKKSPAHNALLLLNDRTIIGVGITKGKYYYSATARLRP